MTREATGVMGSGRSLTDNRASPVTIWEVQAAPVRWARISRLPRRPARSTAARVTRTHSAWTLARDGLNTGSVAVRKRAPVAYKSSRGDIPERNSSGFSRRQQRRFTPVWDRSRIPRLARVGARSTRVGRDPELRAKPTCLVWSRPDRRDSRRGDRGSREAKD